MECVQENVIDERDVSSISAGDVEDDEEEEEEEVNV